MTNIIETGRRVSFPQDTEDGPAWFTGYVLGTCNPGGNLHYLVSCDPEGRPSGRLTHPVARIAAGHVTPDDSDPLFP